MTLLQQTHSVYSNGLETYNVVAGNKQVSPSFMPLFSQAVTFKLAIVDRNEAFLC